MQALSKVFRGKFMAALAAAHQDGKIGHDPQGQDGPWRERQRQLYQHDWVVYAKTPLGGPAQVLEYLSRYTHRTAISNARIRAVNDHGMACTVRAGDHGANCNAKRLVRRDGTEFVRRFLVHVLPAGIKRTRHHGVLASACKGVELQAARLALQMPAASPQAMESAQAFMARVARMDVGLCPCCKVGRLRTIAVLAGLARLPGPACTVAPHSRGPPCAFALACISEPVTGTPAGVRCSVARWRPHARPAPTDSRAGVVWRVQ